MPALIAEEMTDFRSSTVFKYDSSISFGGTDYKILVKFIKMPFENGSCSEF